MDGSPSTRMHGQEQPRHAPRAASSPARCAAPGGRSRTAPSPSAPRRRCPASAPVASGFVWHKWAGGTLHRVLRFVTRLPEPAREDDRAALVDHGLRDGVDVACARGFIGFGPVRTRGRRSHPIERRVQVLTEGADGRGVLLRVLDRLDDVLVGARLHHHGGREVEGLAPVLERPVGLHLGPLRLLHCGFAWRDWAWACVRLVSARMLGKRAPEQAGIRGLLTREGPAAGNARHGWLLSGCFCAGVVHAVPEGGESRHRGCMWMAAPLSEPPLCCHMVEGWLPLSPRRFEPEGFVPRSKTPGGVETSVPKQSSDAEGEPLDPCISN